MDTQSQFDWIGIYIYFEEKKNDMIKVPFNTNHIKENEIC